MCATNPGCVLGIILFVSAILVPLVPSYADIVFGEGLLEPNSLAVAVNGRLQAVGLRDEIRLGYRDGRFDQCAEFLEVVSKSSPGLPPAGVMLVWMHLEVGRINDARLALDKVAAQHLDDPQVTMTLGQVALSEKRLADAAAQVERAVNLQLPDCWSVTENHDFACCAMDTLAAVYEQQNRWKNTSPTLASLIKLNSATVGYRIRLARSQYLSGQRQEAKSTLIEAARIAKATGELDEPLVTSLALGGFSLHENDTDTAATLFRDAMSTNPTDPRPFYAMARLELSLGRAESALHIIDSFQDQEMNIGIFDAVPGDANMLLGNFGQASRIYKAILDRGPDCNVTRQAIVLVLLGEQSNELQQEAKERAQELALQQPHDATALALLGFVHLQLGQPELAKPLLLRAVEISPQMSADVVYFLAELAALDPEGSTDAKRLLVAARQGSRGVFLSKFRADLLAAKLGVE